MRLPSPERRRQWILVALVIVHAVWSVRVAALHARVSEVRRDLAAFASRFEGALQTGTFQGGGDTVVWIHVRDAEGIPRFTSRPSLSPVFSMEFIRSEFRMGHSVYRIVHTHAGSILVAAFPIRLSGGVGVIEIAARLQRAPAVSQPAAKSPVVHYI
jgi:hypothetical protein